MQRFAASIEASLRSHNWFAALFMALALPDICAALEDPNRPVGQRYKDWFQRYLRPAYDPSSMYEMLEASAPEALARMPEQAIEYIKTQPAPADSAFTAEDCYRLRCKCLHQGLPERIGEDRIHFTAPEPNGRLILHRNVFNGVLQISINQFCRDISDAAIRWWQQTQGNPAILVRAAQLVKIYDLDAVELPIVRYGGP